jgi:hypothetical protein
MLSIFIEFYFPVPKSGTLGHMSRLSIEEIKSNNGTLATHYCKS